MTRFVSGDWNVICDVSGFKVKASQTRRQWNNLRVRESEFEERHPQDFVRGVPDHQTVPFARPESTDVFLSPGDVTVNDL